MEEEEGWFVGVGGRVVNVGICVPGLGNREGFVRPLWGWRHVFGR